MQYNFRTWQKFEIPVKNRSRVGLDWGSNRRRGEMGTGVGMQNKWITTIFSVDTLNTRGAWVDGLQSLRPHVQVQTSLPNRVFNHNKTKNTFYDISNFKLYPLTNTTLQKSI